MKHLEVTFALYSHYAKNCEVHRFYMDAIDFLVFDSARNLKDISVLLGCSYDSVKTWSCGRKLPSNDFAILIFYHLYKEAKHGTKFKLWCSKRKNHFNLS